MFDDLIKSLFVAYINGLEMAKHQGDGDFELTSASAVFDFGGREWRLTLTTNEGE
jgi:hypothetical protein